MWLYFTMFWGGLFWLGLASNQTEHPKNDLEHTKNHTVIPWQPNTVYFLYNSALKIHIKNRQKFWHCIFRQCVKIKLKLLQPYNQKQLQ